MIKQILHNLEEVQKWFEVKSPIYAMDFETTGLNYLAMQPVGVSFCDGERACYVSLEAKNNEQILSFLVQIFDSSRNTSLLVVHNAKYDCNCCFKFTGVVPSNIFDTYTAAYILDENRDSYKLKTLAQEDLGVPRSKIKTWEEVEALGHGSPEWYEYCFNDSIWAYQLYEKYSKELKAQNLEYLFYEVEMPFLPVLSYMERTGVLVDKHRLMELQIHVKAKVIELEDQMLGLCGKEVVLQLILMGEPERSLPINFNSSPQVQKVLEGFGLQIPKNRQGKKSLDKKLITPLKGTHPFIDLYLEYKTMKKLLTSYILPTWDFIDVDGRMRPSFGFEVTGRLSCSRPPLQTLPRVSKDHPELNYRSVVVAKEGHSLIAPDYSSQELRMLGIVANDDVIINAFLNNQDLHLLTANSCFDLNLTKAQLTEGTIEFNEAKKTYAEQRYKAKNGANFPIIYGTSAYGVSWRQGVSVKEAQRWIDTFFNLYPNVQKAMEETRTELEKVGWVTTLFGRKRRFPYYRGMSKKEQAGCLRQAFNFKVQGSAADQVKIAMAKVYQSGVSIILQVHDEVICEVPSEKAESMGKEIQACMENAVSFCIPFKADYKIAGSYGLLK